jgi:septal ring factor EnvC (AmiA/AmiB activator)
MEEGASRAPRRRIPTLGQVVSDSFSDVAGLLRVLPEIAGSLRTIARLVEHMDVEVTQMHAAVERLDDEMRDVRDGFGELRESLEDLDDRMATIGAAITRLEPHIADVNLAVRPLRRARARLRQNDDARRADQAELEQDGASGADPLAAGETSATA